MLIIAKTIMTTMPESCKKCSLWVKDTQYYGWCRVRGGSVRELVKRRPSWCPLEEIKETENE